MSELPARLRAALLEADYTFDSVAALLGPTGHAALGRNETVPGLRRTTGGSPLETLTRLFLLQTTVPLADAERALPGLVDRLAVEGLLEQSVGEVAARLDCRPYAAPDAAGEHDFWVVSDLTPGLDGSPVRVGADHVLGISSASTSLAQLTLRHPVGSALDLGTGCGVQALHLATHAERVVATDVNTRALRLARFNAALNDRTGVEVVEGSFFEPVRGQRFDLIATNPPFVISPATGERLVYRDSGLPGDRVVEDIVRAAPDHLTDGGWCQVLANWVVTAGTDWDERLAGWLDPSCDALVVQRELVDPAAYVELWLKDAGVPGTAEYVRRYDTWLSWFEEQGVEAIGFGWINLRRLPGAAGAGSGGRVGSVRLEEWPYDVEQPVAGAVAAWGAATDALRDLDDAALLAATPVRASDVREETVGEPGAADPETIVLRQQRGLRRGHAADTATAAVVGALDGDLPLGAVVDAVASLLDEPAPALRARLVPVVRQLVEEGYLTL